MEDYSGVAELRREIRKASAEICAKIDAFSSKTATAETVIGAAVFIILSALTALAVGLAVLK